MISTSRRAAAVLILSTSLAVTSAVPSHAFPGFGRGPTVEGPEQPSPASRFIHFLLRIFDFAGGAMDPNGNH